MEKPSIGTIGVFFLVFYGPALAEARDSWSFTAFLGSAYNLSTPIHIHQSGEDDL